MKKIIALSAIVIGLAGCSSDDPAANLSSTLTNALLNGTWASGCVDDTPDSLQITAMFNNGTGSVSITKFVGDTTCDPANLATVENETFTYTIGTDVTVDGSVAGITTATQVDFTDTTAGSPDIGTIDYDIFAIKDLITLYIGDTDGANDGSTAALRPIVLMDLPFTKL